METTYVFRQQAGRWKTAAIIFMVVSVLLLVALIVVVVTKNDEVREAKNDEVRESENDEVRESENRTGLPCPPQKGGLLTSGDPDSPGPFHDLTLAEYRSLYTFLTQQTDLNLVSPELTRVHSSSIFTVDLLVPAKRDVLAFLDNQGQQPAREARVVVFRGDKSPPVVEEYRVGPLPNPTYAELIFSPQRTNPVPFAVRPQGTVEFLTVYFTILPHVDDVVGHILTESYGGKFANCGDTCLTIYPTAIGTALLGEMKRQIWYWATYTAEYYTLYPLDFGVRVNLDGSDSSQWSVERVWYSGMLYDSLADLASNYSSDSTISKTRVDYVHTNRTLKSTQNLRGDPAPPSPQRPPVQVEPDGKRYSIQHRHIQYLHWDLDIRLSSLTGPQVYDIRYQGDRIAYELGLSELGVYYSGDSPMQRITDFVDSGALIGTNSKSLIPGADCPESATYLSASFLGEASAEAVTRERAVCVFEQNTGAPLRRHLSYDLGSETFYAGMADSVLVVRSIMAIGNYDYVVDFIFHQSGAIETRAMSTGYILSTFHRPQEAPYGFRLDDNINGNIHHHMFHFKADLDIGGTSNRYETLDISEETVTLREFQNMPYSQTRFDRNLRRTEEEAVYKFNFDHPKYHIVHNGNQQTAHGAPRAFRLHMEGMSKQMVRENMNNEVSIPWARQQLAVTVQKDAELVSSSPYAMFDSHNPVTNFSNFISDESIVDEDLVFWITVGTHHIPHTEDLPVTTTVGGHLGFFLLPYNYFPECPSVSSRDNVRVEFTTPNNPADGLRVERNGNQAKSVCGAPTLEELVRERPDDFLQTS